MKKIVVSLILAVLLANAAGAAFSKEPEQFVFRDVFTWGMSKDEVKTIVPDVKERGERSYAEGAVYEVFTLYPVSVSRYTDAAVAFAFSDDRLYETVYWFNTRVDTDYLMRALRIVYGPEEPFDLNACADVLHEYLALTDIIETRTEPIPVYSADHIARILDPEDCEDFYIWKTADGTTIALMDYENDQAIFYYNPDVRPGILITDGL